MNLTRNLFVTLPLSILAYLIAVIIGLLIIRLLLCIPPIRHLAQSIMHILMRDD